VGPGPVGGSSAGPAKVSSFSRCLLTPQAFADPRLACAPATTSTRVRPLARGRPCSESRRSRQAKPGGRSAGGSERVEAHGGPKRTSGDGTRATPKLRLSQGSEKPSGPRTCGWFIGGAGKSFVVRRTNLLTPQAFADPRLACALATSRSAAGLRSCRSGKHTASLTARRVRAPQATLWRRRLV
jgi:hypothetical protein